MVHHGPDGHRDPLSEAHKTIRLRTRQAEGRLAGVDADLLGFSEAVPQAGIEPATLRLEGGCSLR
jgi:hypothetical protein